jgi:hypothetical protein
MRLIIFNESSLKNSQMIDKHMEYNYGVDPRIIKKSEKRVLWLNGNYK